MKQIEVNRNHVTYEMLKGLYSTEKNAKIKTRLLMIMYFYDGYTSVQVAKFVKVSDFTTRQTLRRYNKHGIYGLTDIPHPPKQYIITEPELDIIDKALKNKPSDIGINYNNWTGKILKLWIKRIFNKEISISNTYKTLHKLKYSKTRAKKRSKNVDKENLEKFRQEMNELLENRKEDTVILYEDEAIVTSEPTSTSVWTKIGTQAIVKTKGGTRKRCVIFGAVNPEKGELFEQVSDAGNADNFKSFLK